MTCFQFWTTLVSTGAFVIAAAASVGLVIIGRQIARRQSAEDVERRREERWYEALIKAGQLLRLSMTDAVRLQYTRSFRTTFFDWTVWKVDWQPFVRTIAEAGTWLTIVADDLDKERTQRYGCARNALIEGKGKDDALLTEYIASTSAVRDEVERMAKNLSRPDRRETRGLPPCQS